MLSIRNAIKFAALVLMGIVTLPLLANSQNKVAVNHIEVFVKPVRVQSGTHSTPPRLTGKNFRLQYQGGVIPIRLSGSMKDALPANLLVVLPVALSRCGEMPELAVLLPKLDRDWRIGIAGSDGRWEPYISGQSICGSSAPAQVHREDAIVHLQQLPGRRAIILVGPVTAITLNEARRTIPEIYAVDGGVEGKTYTPPLVIPKDGPSAGGFVEGAYTVPPGGIDGGIRPNGPYTEGVTATHRKSGFSHNVMHEKTFKSAFADLRRASNRYYDLSFTMPDVSGGGNAPLHLSFRHVGDLSVAVDMYSVNTEGDGELLRRDITMTKLELSQK